MSFAVISAHVAISVTWQYFLLNNIAEIYALQNNKYLARIVTGTHH